MTDPLNYFVPPEIMENLVSLIKETVEDLVKITNLTQEQAIKLANEKFDYLNKNYKAAINKQVLLDACLNKL